MNFKNLLLSSTGSESGKSLKLLHTLNNLTMVTVIWIWTCCHCQVRNEEITKTKKNSKRKKFFKNHITSKHLSFKFLLAMSSLILHHNYSKILDYLFSCRSLDQKF